MSERVSGVKTALVVALLIVVLLAGQLAAGRIANADSSLGTGRAVGRATFAYLSGLRVFAAQVLWNRIEPLLHEFYTGIPLREQAYMLPTLSTINTLDPQFVQPYYVAPWIIAQQVDEEVALDVAEEGVRNNPRSGLLRGSYAQLLLLFAEDKAAAYEQARIARGENMEWFDDIEKHDTYAVLRYVYRAYGDTAGEREIEREIERLDALIGDELPEDGHDHGGEGAPSGEEGLGR